MNMKVLVYAMKKHHNKHSGKPYFALPTFQGRGLSKDDASLKAQSKFCTEDVFHEPMGLPKPMEKRWMRQGPNIFLQDYTRHLTD